MLFIFSFAGTQICASSGGPNCKCWCSKSPRLVLKIASAGAQNRLGWCSKSPRLVLRFVLPLVVPIASAGARNRLGWCSKSPPLVLKIAWAGAQNRLGWCSNLCFLWCLFFMYFAAESHLNLLSTMCVALETMPFFPWFKVYFYDRLSC